METENCLKLWEECWKFHKNCKIYQNVWNIKIVWSVLKKNQVVKIKNLIKVVWDLSKLIEMSYKII